MQALPHHYAVVATASTTSDVTLDGARLPTLHSAPPTEFGGPGDRWSPETLLVAAAADCYVLTFRALAHASNLAWIDVTCEMIGTLARPERTTEFTAFRARVRLQIPPGASETLARRLLERAERACLVSNSLKAATALDTEVVVAPAAAPADASPSLAESTPAD